MKCCWILGYNLCYLLVETKKKYQSLNFVNSPLHYLYNIHLIILNFESFVCLFVVCIVLDKKKNGGVCGLLDQGLKIFYLGSMEIDIVKWLKLYIFPNDYTLLPFFYRFKLLQAKNLL